MTPFALRTPSDAWEPALLPDSPGCLWVWYRPPHAPDGFFMQVPDEARSTAGVLTMQHVLAAAGVTPEEVATWSLLGGVFDALGGTNPLLDHPLPALPPGDAGNIVVQMRPRMAVPPISMPVAPVPPYAAPAFVPPVVAPAFVAAAPLAAFPPAVAGMPGTGDEMFAAFESEWQMILQAETNMAATRQQLLGLQQRLQSLNRELSPDERVNADSLDKRDWHDARRWLREGATHIARHLRDHEIGVTSGAGIRHRSEQLYNEFIVPRRPFEGMAQALKNFEQHRKNAQHLLSSMQQTLSNASRDGEQRAQQILTRIAAKVRTGSRKTKR
jgi:hypothetical protein